MPDIKYNIVDNFDHTFDEKGNAFLALRKLTWGDSDNVKLDIRKWYTNSSGEETLGKGVSFLTDEGPHELVKVLIENDYGKTDEIIKGIKDREDFKPALVKALGKNSGLLEEIDMDTTIDDDYYDPKEMLF